MRNPGLTTEEQARYWDAAYAGRGARGVSWYQAEPRVSLELIDTLAVGKEDALIDVGGGASTLVDHLVGRGFTDLAVLDVSVAALTEARNRVGEAAPVTWLQEDVSRWRPERRFTLWHDRAVFHFLVTTEDRDAYLRTLRSALRDNGLVVVATFAPDGPEVCSGLPVARYSPADLATLLGAQFELLLTRREEHITPGGMVQPFTWVAGRMRAAEISEQR